jgi:hypothetical protein
MRMDESDQSMNGKSPGLIYQCLCTEIPKDIQPSHSKIKNLLSIKEWLFPKTKDSPSQSPFYQNKK